MLIARKIVPMALVLATAFLCFHSVVRGRSKAFANAWSAKCQAHPERWLHPLEDPQVSTQAALLDPRLLWGTYRPSVYFGFKSRTAPEAVTGGLLWYAGGRTVGQARHDCQEGDRLDQYGWTRHNGVSYGEQDIVDKPQQLKLKTMMVKPSLLDFPDDEESSDGWQRSTLIASRVEVTGTSRQTEQTAALFWYFGVDFDGNPQPDTGADFSLALKSVHPSSLTLEVWTEKLGRMELQLQVVSGKSDSSIALSYWGGRGIDFADIHQHLKAECDSQPGGICELPNTVQAESNLLCTAVYGSLPLTLDMILTNEVADSGTSGPHREELFHLLTKWLNYGAVKFDEDFEKVYQLQKKGFEETDIQVAKVALSNMIGGLGYFHGQNLIRSSVTLPNNRGEREVHLRSFDSSLFSAVPSRSFFPRGFLWDEGFHQLLILQWDSAITLDVVRHWMNTVHIYQAENNEDDQCLGGWIPREQILGETARRRVPSEFIPQDIDVANPPTLMLVLRSLLQKLEETCSTNQQCSENDTEAVKIQSLIKEVAPKVNVWVQWLLHSQRPVSGTEVLFQWQGRNPQESKLIPNTLASGLDDYPRSIPPHPEEAHVDLICWMILCCQVMAQIQNLFPQSNQLVKNLPYGQMEKDLLTALHTYHWNEEHGGFYDLGVYSESGTIVSEVVVRCMSKEHRAKDIGVPIELYNQLEKINPCPRDYPKLAYPLGDGQGGLLMRERYAAKSPSFGHVVHAGYTTIFPLILKLLDPSSERLGRLLDLIHDEGKLWSPYGLRSLSKDNIFYGKENAPGDAPYWRGYIWMNINYLTLDALRHYSTIDGPHKDRCRLIYEDLRKNLITLVLRQYQSTGYFWEQYHDQNGQGLRSHPFTGWTALILNIMAEIY